MYNRLVAHLESSHFFGDQKHGFRKNKSIVTALVNFSDGIYYVYCWKTNEFKPVNNVPQAFFTEDYEKRHPEEAVLIHKLQDLIALQVPLLDVGIKLHGERAPAALIPFQQHLVSCFNEKSSYIEKRYGKKVRVCRIYP